MRVHNQPHRKEIQNMYLNNRKMLCLLILLWYTLTSIITISTIISTVIVPTQTNLVKSSNMKSMEVLIPITKDVFIIVLAMLAVLIYVKICKHIMTSKTKTESNSNDYVLPNERQIESKPSTQTESIAPITKIKTAAKAIVIDAYTLSNKHANNKHSIKNIVGIIKQNDHKPLSPILTANRGKGVNNLNKQHLRTTIEVLYQAIDQKIPSIEIGYTYDGVWKYAIGEWNPDRKESLEYVQELNQLSKQIEITFTKLTLNTKDTHTTVQSKFQPLLESIL